MRKTSSSSTDASRTGLTPVLGRLIASPRRFGAVSLWKALNPDERMAAATSYLGDEAGGRERLNQIVARAWDWDDATMPLRVGERCAQRIWNTWSRRR